MLDVNFGHGAAKRRCDYEIMCNIPIVAPLKMCIVVVGKKNGVRKLRMQCPQNHQFVVNVRTEEANGANT